MTMTGEFGFIVLGFLLGKICSPLSSGSLSAGAEREQGELGPHFLPFEMEGRE